MQVFLSCVSEKEDHRCKAKDMYISPLFKKSFQVAQKMHPDKIYILSAKHYLLGLNDVIEPYNLTLNDMGVEERQKWADKVIDIMKKKHINFSEKTYFFAGNNYIEFLKNEFSNYEEVYGGKQIGDILHNLDKKLNEDNKCRMRHLSELL